MEYDIWKIVDKIDQMEEWKRWLINLGLILLDIFIITNIIYSL